MGLRKTQPCEEILKALHRYSVLIDYIIPELQTQNKMKIFLIRNIIYTLMDIIKENNNEFNNEISIAASKYFKRFSEKCLPYCNDVFENFLTLIISTFVPIAKVDTALGLESIAILNFLIVENSSLLYSAIGKLDPFPNTSQFEAIQEIYNKIKYGNDKFTLRQEITHFLEAGKLFSASCRLEGLIFLKNQLRNKAELSKLYAELHDMEGYSEDCEESILHQLICMLVQLASSSDSDIRLEAARCLGELGPADLTTMVLKPEKKLKADIENPFELITGQAITLLSEYLVDSDIQVIVEATKALKIVLSSKEGKLVTKSHFIDDFGCGKLDLNYIMPFLTIKKSSDVKLTINDEYFERLVNDSELWLPTSNTSHSDWIVKLVCNILQTFPKNCFLGCFIPVCKVKFEFAEHLFPVLVFLILYYNKKQWTDVISNQINNFFLNHWIYYKDNLSQDSNRSFISQNRASVQSMLNAIHFVRLKQNSKKEAKRTGELNLNYLHVAKGAQFCSAHFTSILYAELWCYNILDSNMTSAKNMLSVLDYVCKTEDADLTDALQNILREVSV